MARSTRADAINPGAVIHNGPHPLHVEEVSCNSMGHVILRCAYSPGDYPATSLILPPAELVQLEESAK
jgi:hypothetical protein